jgi:hypothetical protein
MYKTWCLFPSEKSALWILSSVIILFSPSLHAENRVKNYSICYGQLLGKPVPASDEILKRVIDGKITDAQACRELVDHLKPENLKSSDPIGLTLLRRLNRLHSTFFIANDFYTEDLLYTMADLYEAEAPAYALTYNFLNNQKLNKVLSGQEQYYGVRLAPPNLKREYFWTKRMSGGRLRFSERQWVAPGQKKVPPFVQRGELLDIAVDSKAILVVKDDRVPASNGTPMVQEIFKPHQGGGIIGMPEYILLNNKEETFDGGVQSYRRYGDRIVNDFLCRNLPVLKDSDVLTYVEPKSELPWRKSESCMACHATMDPMGRIIGHVDIGITSTYSESLQYTYVKPVRQQMTSTFRYRTLDDQLLQIPIANPEELGKVVSGLDDFYWCMARRYYNFVSGADVNYTPVAAERNAQQKGVLALAQRLKKNQSLRELLSEAYELRFELEKTR